MNNHYQQLLLYGDGETCLGSVRGQFVFIIVCHLIVSIYMREREESLQTRTHTKNLMSSPQTNRQAMEVNRGGGGKLRDRIIKYRKEDEVLLKGNYFYTLMKLRHLIFHKWID